MQIKKKMLVDPKSISKFLLVDLEVGRSIISLFYLKNIILLSS